MKNQVVKSKEEAYEWFLSHSSGTVIASHRAMGDIIRICATYDQAARFFYYAEALEASKNRERV